MHRASRRTYIAANMLQTVRSNTHHHNDEVADNDDDQQQQQQQKPPAPPPQPQQHNSSRNPIELINNGLQFLSDFAKYIVQIVI